MKGYAVFYNGMERDLANHNQGLEQSVLENGFYTDKTKRQCQQQSNLIYSGGSTWNYAPGEPPSSLFF